jgi:diaminopimelate epimerase
MTGAGNDFIFIDLNENKYLSPLSSETIKSLCDRRFGIGADGVITICNLPDNSFKMEYFNSDGSTGSLCGNGARCALWFSKLKYKPSDSNMKFIYNGSEYRGEIIENEKVKFYLKSPTKVKLNFRVKIFNQLIKASFVNTGSPHLVVNIADVLKDTSQHNACYDSLENFPVFDFGRGLRYHPDFSPQGTNVNFYQDKGDELIIRTYERGVEAETLACGTGSVATALVCFLLGVKKPPIEIKTWGGDSLVVNFDVENKRISNLSLTGPAKLVFSGEIEI